MPWQTWLLAILIGLNASWMAFDGLRALIVGDYVTPRRGPSVGRLGPWSSIVRAAGIDPRSRGCKVAVASYGFATLGLLACLLIGFPWARGGVLAAAILGLLYLPVGTMLNGIALILWFLAPSGR
jgi:hypothetical protein